MSHLIPNTEISPNKKRKAYKNFGPQIEPNIKEVEIPLSTIHNTVIRNLSCWIIRIKEINLKLRKRRKIRNQLIFQDELEKFKINYPRH